MPLHGYYAEVNQIEHLGELVDSMERGRGGRGRGNGIGNGRGRGRGRGRGVVVEAPPAEAAVAGGVAGEDPLVAAVAALPAAAAAPAISQAQQKKYAAALASIQADYNAAPPAQVAVDQAAAVPADGIYAPNCLPDPANEDERLWKRTLFYILGYCDTFHDFSKARSTEDQGKSINPKLIADRTTYVKTNIINKMDPIFNWSANYSVNLDTFRRDQKYGTFENAMFGAFTRMKKNPIFDGLEASIQTHIQGVLGTDNLIIQTLDEKSFQGEKPNRHSSTTILEMTAPEVVYSKAWRDNFVEFLKDLYPTCVDEGKLKFVEDTASFPRNIFTGANPHFGEFKKIVTIQTKWDPAGLSSFEPNAQSIRNLVAAPSFLAMDTHATATAAGASAYNKTVKFNQVENKLITGAGAADFIEVKKAGPSVNHLFMHMVYHSPPAGMKPADKLAIKNMITRAVLDSKSKNITYKLNTAVAAGDDNAIGAELRKLTASKRSGDYENIHSAMINNAVQFTGDEPAFTYAVMNRQPAVYHICSAAGHTFRFYAPQMIGAADIAADAIFQKTLTNASELAKFLGANRETYLELLNNIEKYTNPGTLTVKGDTLTGYLLQAIVLEMFDKTLKSILEATTAMRTSYLAQVADEYRAIIDRLINVLKEIPKNPTPDQVTLIAQIREQQKKSTAALQAKVDAANDILEKTRQFLPRNFVKEETKTAAKRAEFFVKTSELSATAIYKDPAAAAAAREPIMYAPLTYLPQSSYITKSIGAVASLVLQIKRTEGEAIKQNIRVSLVQNLRETLMDLNCPDSVIALFPDGSDTVSTVEVTPAAPAGAMSPIKRAVKALYNTFITKKGQLAAIAGGANKKKSKRSRTRKHHKPIDYLAMAKSIEESMKGESLPFDLTPDTYAAAIVERVQCLEALEAAFGSRQVKVEESVSVPEYVKEYLELPPDKEFTKGVQQPDLQLQNEDHLPLVQTGGARAGEEVSPLISFMIDFFTNKVAPFIRIHFVYEPGETFFGNILRSIYAGTFIVDLFALLHEIGSLPGEDMFQDITTTQGERSKYRDMIKQANTALGYLYTGIQKCKNDATKLILRQRFGSSMATVETIQGMLIGIQTNPSTVCSNLFSLCTFLGNIILEVQTQGSGQGPAQVTYRRGRETYFKNRYSEVCTNIEAGVDMFTGDDNRRKIFNTLKYPFLEWYQIQYESELEAAAPAVAAAGQAPPPPPPPAEEVDAQAGVVDSIDGFGEGEGQLTLVADLVEPAAPAAAPVAGGEGGHGGGSRRSRHRRRGAPGRKRNGSPRRRTMKNRR